jgi:NAD(P)-dependent dehydrogenase (short-subunit alcohol dehydrogenase family)
VLINSAGIASFNPVLDITDQLWEKIQAVNVKGILIMIQAVLPDMMAAGWGRIVNISSLAGSHGAPRMAHYGASKAAVIGLTKSLALELGACGVTVNSVAPGLIDTPMSSKSEQNGDFGMSLADIAKTQPSPRMGTAAEIAEACAYFASDLAGFTTGQLIGVNGGTAM